MAETTPAITTHVLPPPFSSLTNDSTVPLPALITQGAEALIYKTHILTPSTACALKYRPSKSYRHPTLDARLTKSRILAEARVLVRCRRAGVKVPAVLGLDWDNGWLAQEWIEGLTVRECLDQWLRARVVGEEVGDGLEKDEEKSRELWDLMGRVGRAVGRMHEIGVVHGDLTTSNLMLRPSPGNSLTTSTTTIPHIATSTTGQHTLEAVSQSSPSVLPPAETQRQLPSLSGEIVIIDFGLASQSVQDEDKAVDLYVLERAFSSTHPQTAPLFRRVLEAYGESYKGARSVLRRLEDVRARGRKRSMVG